MVDDGGRVARPTSTYSSQRYPGCLDFATQFHHGLNAFPGHAFGPLQPRVDRAQLGAMPMQFQNPPTALKRVILAVIRRVIEELDRLADGIDQLHHAMKKLRTHAAALWAVVHFELDPFGRALFLNAEPLPPGRERIDEEVAGLSGTAEGHMELGRVFIDDPTWDILLPVPEVMVTRFVLPTSFPPARELAKFDRGFTVHAQPLDSRDGLVFF